MTEEQIDRIMAYMMLSDFRQCNQARGLKKLPLTHFSGATPILENTGIGLEDERIVSISNTNLHDVRDINVDFSILQEANKSDDNAMWNIIKYTLMSSKDKRGWPLSHLQTLRADVTFVQDNATYSTARTHFIKQNGVWQMYFPRQAPMSCLGGKEIDGTSWDDRIGTALGLLYCNEFYWTAEIGYQYKPSVKFQCTPEGSKELFRLRDIPEGKQRRTAIKHWVGGHHRTAKGGNKNIQIEKYLRGETDFTWNGLRCTIRPSPSDLREYYNLHPSKKHA